MGTYLFVFGLPRSGTTIMTELLNLHEDILIPSETSWVYNIYDLFSIGNFDNNHHMKASLNTGDSPINLLLSISRLKYFYDIEPEFIVRAVGESLRIQFNYPRYTGDKDVYHCSRISLVRSIFPDCKIIAMYRPLEECIESANRNNCHLGNPEDTPQILEKELNSMNEQLSHMNDICGVDLRILKEDPIAVMSNVLQYLDLYDGEYDIKEVLRRVKR
jgi:hypothetical protein